MGPVAAKGQYDRKARYRHWIRRGLRCMVRVLDDRAKKGRDLGHGSIRRCTGRVRQSAEFLTEHRQCSGGSTLRGPDLVALWRHAVESQYTQDGVICSNT